MPVSMKWRFAAVVALPVLASALSGCGGSSAIGNTSTARIRALDAAVNNNVADILINGGATYGDQSFFSGPNNTIASPYQYIDGQNGASFSYLLPNQSIPNSATAATNTANIDVNNFYTAVLIGSYYAAYGTTPSDPRILQTILLPARAASSATQATLRVVNAAPDLGFSTQTSSGTTSYTTGSVNVAVGTAPAATFSGVQYGSATNYTTLPPGTYPVTVTLVGSGSSVTTTTQTITVSAGNVYTLYLAEPSASPATYDLKLLSD